MPHNVASYQGLHCLLTGFPIKNRIKVTKQTQHPLNNSRLVQHVTVEESTSIQWVDPTALRKVKLLYNFGLFECNMVKLDKQAFRLFKVSQFLKSQSISHPYL